MATYYARKAGNVNATDVWATTPTGTAGDFFPSFTNSDTLMANGFTITLNVNTTVLEIRNDTTGGATVGGTFILNGGLTLTANVYCGGGLPTVQFSAGSPAISTIIGNVSSVAASTSYYPVVNAGNGTLNIVGNVTGGSSNTAYGALLSGNGILNVTGNVTGGSSASSNAFGISNIAALGIVNITGNVTGGSVTGNHGVYNSSAGTINISGTVTGGVGAAAYGAMNNSNGTIIITGVAIGSSVGIGAFNNSTGTLTVTRAKGNGFGNGSVGLNSVVGVSASQGGLTRVYEIEYGDLGQSPTSGPVFLFPASSNVALFYRSGTSKKTLVDASSSSGLLPNQSDVRVGTTYNAGTNTGTMAVPAAASVALGVSVDNTTGTAILTSGNIADIWNYPVSGISVSNSIGERLKNCSTVSTMGQQLAAALSNIN